jgi:hypothetical protein
VSHAYSRRLIVVLDATVSIAHLGPRDQMP